MLAALQHVCTRCHQDKVEFCVSQVLPLVVGHTSTLFSLCTAAVATQAAEVIGVLETVMVCVYEGLCSRLGPGSESAPVTPADAALATQAITLLEQVRPFRCAAVWANVWAC